MKSQQEAEREEQLRIKNLVLNYDLRDEESQDGTDLLGPIKQLPLHKSSYAKSSLSRPRPPRSEPQPL
jgi:regulator of nonsense transcripts 2